MDQILFSIIPIQTQFIFKRTNRELITKAQDKRKNKQQRFFITGSFDWSID